VEVGRGGGGAGWRWGEVEVGRGGGGERWRSRREEEQEQEQEAYERVIPAKLSIARIAIHRLLVKGLNGRASASLRVSLCNCRGKKWRRGAVERGGREGGGGGGGGG
jgi:hypothetical protein